ncbi:helix-turn-helix domain-containing protein [Clostridium formicaceticum]|uniref:HTH-type transcriptional regulator Xre n=1 Tax=Clostridium formicaceticum TaxID=1497 RepID=A0AAC9WH69_9CLOT|nr:helix-turn-helix transcriptional regulator [Clostridium formicaceticum]AOY78145.1 hypothetical protein BJL90_21135 [Clostridium formicaceticum]ARE88797.1 HTH-type transcriptional regulator Xre [Clostridium formicaceticum]
MNFSHRLKQLRKEKKLTQEDLAIQLNKTRSTVAGYETERKEPDYDTLKKIAEFFDVSIDYLLGHSDTPHSYSSKNCITETKARYGLDNKDLPDEAIKQIEDYIEFIKQKYHSSENNKKKS